MNNGQQGVYVKNSGGWLTVINCISRDNGSNGYYAYGDTYSDGIIYLSYSNGNTGGSGTFYASQGVINVDPGFISTSLNDYHISSGSPCWNTGHPGLKDPDGTRSDMGYFGGPDAPVYPVVYEITTSPNGNNINIQAKARANY